MHRSHHRPRRVYNTPQTTMSLLLTLGFIVFGPRTFSQVQPVTPAAGPPAPAVRSGSTSHTDSPDRPAGADPHTPPDRLTQRSGLNLAGQTDSGSGESRRNENVQFNLIDNNSVKELKTRLGTTATVVTGFRPDQNYFASEYGDPPASSPHLALSSTLRAIHGTLRETHSNSIFSARSFFQVGSVKPAHSNDYGFTLGAPLWSGADVDLGAGQQKIRGIVNGNVLVPTLEERTPLTADPDLRALVLRFLSAFPQELPNRTDFNPRALNTNSPQSIDTSTAYGRLSQSIGTADRVFARYDYTRQAVRAFQFVAGQNPDTTTGSTAGRLTWTHTASPAAVSDFSLSFERLRSLLSPEPNAVGPTVSFGSVLTGLGPSSDLPINRAQNQLRAAWRTQWVHRRFTWMAGAQLNRRQVNGLETSSNRGVIYFNSDFGRDAITNFRLGIAGRMTTGIGNSVRGFRYWEPMSFVGGTWRPAGALSLSWSLRHTPVLGPSEVNGLTRIPYQCDCNNFAPRLGLGYNLPARWGVLRAAYGLEYSDIYPVTFQQLRFTAPEFLKIEVQAPANMLDPLAGIQVGPGVRTTRFEMTPDLVAPYSHLYSFSWELSPARPFAAQLGYVGSRSHQLLMLWTTNRAGTVEGIEKTTRTIEQRRANPAYYEVRRVVNASNAYFDALRLSISLRDLHGLTIQGSWWWSKAIDLGANYTSTATGDDVKKSQTEFDVLRDLKGLSSFDQPHAFVLRASYVTPAGRSALARALGRLNLSAVFLAKSGTPFDVVTGSDAPGYGNVDGTSGDRPNLLDPSVLGRTIGDPDSSAARMPRAAFAYLSIGEMRGSLGRSVFRKGGIRNCNAAVSRTWPVRGDTAFTLRLEANNLFNTPQFGQPGSELSSSNFGHITNTLNDGRSMELGLSLRF